MPGDKSNQLYLGWPRFALIRSYYIDYIVLEYYNLFNNNSYISPVNLVILIIFILKEATSYDNS